MTTHPTARKKHSTNPKHHTKGMMANARASYELAGTQQDHFLSQQPTLVLFDRDDLGHCSLKYANVPRASQSCVSTCGFLNEM